MIASPDGLGSSHPAVLVTRARRSSAGKGHASVTKRALTFCRFGRWIVGCALEEMRLALCRFRRGAASNPQLLQLANGCRI